MTNICKHCRKTKEEHTDFDKRIMCECKSYYDYTDEEFEPLENHTLNQAGNIPVDKPSLVAGENSQREQDRSVSDISSVPRETLADKVIDSDDWIGGLCVPVQDIKTALKQLKEKIDDEFNPDVEDIKDIIEEIFGGLAQDEAN